MKKHLNILAVMALLTVFTATGAFAQDNGPRKMGPGGPRIAPGSQDEGPTGEGILNSAKRLGLSDEQKEKVKDLWQVQKEKLENWKTQSKPRLEELRKEMQKIMESRKELHEDFMKQLSGVLTDEQMEKLKKWGHQRRTGPQPKLRVENMLEKLNLTDEQKQQLKTLRDETHKKLQASKDPKAKREILEQQMEKMKGILSEEQFEQFKKFHRPVGPGMGAPRGEGRPGMGERGEKGRPGMAVRDGDRGPFAQLDLTDEQKATLKSIREKYQDQITDAEPGQRREVMEKMREEIQSVLTDEQKEKMKQMRSRGGRRGQGGPEAEQD